jgi:hypothetical protein
MRTLSIIQIKSKETFKMNQVTCDLPLKKKKKKKKK